MAMKESGGSEVKTQSSIKAGRENATEKEEDESEGDPTSAQDLRSVRPEEHIMEKQKGKRC